MADLGDISEFLKEGSVSNLDWLEVDAEKYRKEEPLPKQNLDIVPDLEAAWAHDDSTPAQIVPNRAGQPRTMGDMSIEHGLLRASPADIRKTARLALMQSDDLNRFKHALTSRFDRDSLRAARGIIAEVLQERGLLGKVYVEASDFEGCHTGRKTAAAYVQKFASEAKFVVAKAECVGCIHAHESPMGTGQTCSVFHKEIQVEVPYTDALANEAEALQAAKGKAIQAGEKDPKKRVRLAMLAPNQSFAATGLPRQRENVQRLMRAVDEQKQEEQVQVVEAKKASPVVSFLQREMLKGRSASELQESLQVAFPEAVLAASKSHWEPLLREAGLYGVVYSTQDSFADCREGADFIAKHNPGIRVLVAGSKCGSCIYHKVSRCMMYGKPLVQAAADVETPEMVDRVLTEHKSAGRIAPWDSRLSWGETPREALQALHTASTYKGGASVGQTRESVVKAFHGGLVPAHMLRRDAKREIVTAARRYLNEGLYGRDLGSLMKSQFDPRDLTAAAKELRPIIAENQGLQGIYFVDPTVYADYGRGCEEAARLHRTRGVPYVQAGSKCGSCVLQTNNHCSKINKKLVANVPYDGDKKAIQQEILATGSSTEINLENLVNNGRSMMAEFEIQDRGMEIDLDTPTTTKPLNVSFK